MNPRDHVVSLPNGNGNAGQPLTDKAEVLHKEAIRAIGALDGKVVYLTNQITRAQRRANRQQRRIEELTNSLRWTQFALAVLAVADIVWVVAS